MILKIKLYIYKYNLFNKIKKDIEIKIYIIINKRQCEEKKNNDIYLYFGDATYWCLPPTLRNYKLYVISGYNFIIKK